MPPLNRRLMSVRPVQLIYRRYSSLGDNRTRRGAAQRLLLVECAVERRVIRYESRSWINRGYIGDYQRGCDLRDDGSLDAMRLIDGIFIVASTV